MPWRPPVVWQFLPPASWRAWTRLCRDRCAPRTRSSIDLRAGLMGPRAPHRLALCRISVRSRCTAANVARTGQRSQPPGLDLTPEGSKRRPRAWRATAINDIRTGLPAAPLSPPGFSPAAWLPGAPRHRDRVDDLPTATCRLSTDTAGGDLSLDMNVQVHGYGVLGRVRTRRVICPLLSQ
jgi:hypothetical protein